MDNQTSAPPQTEMVRKSFVSEITGTLLVLFGVLVLLALLSFQTPAPDAPVENIVGTAGHYSARILLLMFGNASYLLGPFLAFTGFLYMKRSRIEEPVLRAVAAIVLLIAFAVLFFLIQGVDPKNFASGGGVVGRRLGHGMQIMFGFYGALIIALGIVGSGALLATRLPATEFLQRFSEMFERQTMVTRKPRSERSVQSDNKGQGLVDQAASGPGNHSAHHGSPQGQGNAASGENMAASKDQPPLIEKESGETRPWITKIAMPGPGSMPVSPKPSESFAHDSFSPDAQSTRPPRTSWERPLPFGGSLAASARSASVAAMLGKLARHATPPSDGTDSNDGDEQSLRGTFTSDGRRYVFGRHGDLSGRAFDRARTAYRRPFASESGAPAQAVRTAVVQAALAGGSAVQDPPAAGEGEPPRPYLHPMRIQIASGSAAEPKASAQPKSGAGNVRSNPSLQLPSAVDAALDPERGAVAVAQPLEAPDPQGEVLAVSAEDEFPQSAADSDVDLTDVVDAADDLVADSLEVDDADADATDDAEDLRETSAILRRSMVEARSVQAAVVPESQVPPLQLSGRTYRIPPEILDLPKPLPKADTDAEIELTKRRLEQAMHDYGIQGKVVRTQRGPIVTLFEVKLEPGVKVSRILGISDEIKMHLEAASVRIMAPMPGRSTIGIEIPNRSRETVVLGELVRRDDTFFTPRRELSLVLGKDIAGNNQYIDLTTLPHLLMAGATGSGKSVYMNTVIASLLYTRSPEDVRLIMIDPKMVELTLFEGIPHLLMPVITDVRMASKALSWAVGEMERRYAMLSSQRCRDIRSYNERIAGNRSLTKLPYLVLLIDELSDLMMVAAKDVEDSIIRLTQKARAVGIHVIMATQRPSVDVITALIKANCPARIAFQVAQRTDSRTILDANGAEALVGRGDMLYKSPSASGLKRVQALLITEDEIERIVAEARRFGKPSYVELPGDSDDSREASGAESDADEELFDEAWQVVMESGKTSTSYIQRRLRIGYNRAARLIEMMEERGLLGPAIGTRPREILKKA